MRKVIEVTAAAGLDVQITGNGTAREQAPAPGTQVPSRHEDRRPLRSLMLAPSRHISLARYSAIYNQPRHELARPHRRNHRCRRLRHLRPTHHRH